MTTADFYKLLSPSDATLILEELVEESSEVAIKINDVYSRFKVIKRKNETEILLSRISINTFKQQRVSGYFELDRQKYFFKTSLTTMDDGIIMTIPVDIFQLQRRDNFRMVVPTSVPYKAEIQTINGKRNFISAEIRDLSLGGCLLVVKNQKFYFDQNDEIQLKLKILELEKDLIACEVKHVTMLSDSTKIQMGLSFTDPDADLLTDLQSLMIHLDRIHRGKKYD